MAAARASGGCATDSEAAPREPDGDIPIRHGSTMCYIRSIDDPPSVRLCAPMVVDVPRTPELLEALNDINMHITVGRVFHMSASGSCPAWRAPSRR